MSTGVDLGPAVGGHEAQDLRHLLEHVQTVDVDLGAGVKQVVSSSRRRRRSPLCSLMCVSVCMWAGLCCYLRAELLPQVGEQIFVSIGSFAVEPHDVIGALTDPVSDQLQDAVQTGLLRANTKALVYQRLSSKIALKFYFSRKTVIYVENNNHSAIKSVLCFNSLTRVGIW